MSFFRKHLTFKKVNQTQHSEDGPPRFDEHTMLVNLLILPWNASSIDDATEELRVSPDIRVSKLMDLIYVQLSMGKFGIRRDQMQLWALDGPDIAEITSLRYDGSDPRLVPLTGRRTLQASVNPRNEDLLFIARPNILDPSNNRTFIGYLQFTSQHTNILLQGSIPRNSTTSSSLTLSLCPVSRC
jgi:hypothetical protein